MAHPKSGVSELAQCSYVYTLTVKNKSEYWDINLNPTQNAQHIVKTKVWTHKGKEPILIEISNNDKYCIITLPDDTVYTASIRDIDQSSQLAIDKIKEKKEHELETEQFHELLNTLGIRFEIDFNQYKNDSDYMTVYFQGREIYSGRTEDLCNE